MKYLLLVVLLAGGPTWSLLTWVRARNKAVAAGAAAYARGDAAQAARAFAAAAREAAPHRQPDPRLLLNLAHAQARAGQTEAAQFTYGRLLSRSPAALGSVARQQLAGLAAQRGELAQALGLFRQALLLNPRNAGARYNYEALSDYLAHQPNRLRMGPPPAPRPGAPKPSPEKNSAEKNKPAEKTGTNRPGEVNTSQPTPTAPTTPPQRRPDPTGRPDNQRPSAGPGSVAGSPGPGTGTPQPLASGAAPGSQRGLDRNTAAANPTGNAQGNRPGTDAATAADLSLQTQRERLRAMSLSPAQARQLLETLRAQEQQYLQQLTRPATQKPDPSQPTW